MGKWEMVRLGDAATFVNGYPFKPSEWTTQGLPIIRIQNLTESSNVVNHYDKAYNSRYEINDGDILISWSASLGVYEWNKGKALLNQHIFKVVFDKINFDKRFFKYVVEQKIEEMIRFTHGSTMKHITKKYFDEIQVFCPPLTTQQKIADTLDRANALIEKRKAQIAKLDLLVKSQFVEMFGDPVTNPMGWDMRTIASLARVETGATPNRENSNYFGGNIPWIKTGEVDDCYIFDAEETITEQAINETNCKILPVDTILVAMYGQGKTRGKAAVMKLEASINQACAAILPSDSYITTYLFITLLMSYESLRDLGRGGNQPNLNLSIVKNYVVPLPPLPLQAQFATFVERTEVQKAQLKKSIALLELNYKSLMQKCFSGEML